MALNSFLTEAITVRSPSGSADRHGRDELSSAITVRARAERRFKVVVDKERERQPVHMAFIVGPGNEIEIGAKITYGGRDYRVLERNDAPGRRGKIHHYELMCQYWSFG